MLPLVYGGAVAWNCMDSNVEVAYELRRRLIKHCIKFTDKYIYNSVGEVSLCDIVYRMGNYYLLEDLLQFNRTEIWYLPRSNETLTKENKRAFSKVKKYMLELKEELKEVSADKNALKEIKCNCDMVIFFAGLLSGEKGDYKKEAENIIEEFKILWDMNNKTVGKDEFISFVRETVKKFI